MLSELSSVSLSCLFVILLEFPPSITQLTALEVINNQPVKNGTKVSFANWGLTSADALVAFLAEHNSACTDLDLRSNKLDAIPSGLSRLSSLKTLDISNNTTLGVPELEAMLASHLHLCLLPLQLEELRVAGTGAAARMSQEQRCVLQSKLVAGFTSAPAGRERTLDVDIDWGQSSIFDSQSPPGADENSCDDLFGDGSDDGGDY